MLFFVLIVIISELTTKAFNLQQADHALLAFTTSARNAPLMLAVATAIFPEQPLIYATISIAMLIEFPHLMKLIENVYTTSWKGLGVKNMVKTLDTKN